MSDGPTDPFDIVRRLYRAINARDFETLADLYAARATAEQVFDAADVLEGRDAIVAAYRAAPAVHVDVRTVGGIETGWGWVQADWVETAREAADETVRAGHSHFLIDRAQVIRHRRVVTAHGAAVAAARPASSRRYPARPITGIGAVILCSASGPLQAPFTAGATDLGVVLIKRRHEPLAGHWSLPGGTLDLGETLESATAREALEETGLVVDVGPLVEVFDRILLDEAGKVRYHFVLIDYLCRVVGGRLAAGSDAVDAVVAPVSKLEHYRLTGKAADVIRKATAMTTMTAATDRRD